MPKLINIYNVTRSELLLEQRRMELIMSKLQTRHDFYESVTEKARLKYRKKQELKPALKRMRQIELRLKVMTNG